MARESEVSTIPQIRRVFRDTMANLNLLAGLRDGALGYATDDGILYRQNGDGAANWEAVTVMTPTNSGSYIGNNTANRAIAHGLGIQPKIVLVWQENVIGTALFVLSGAAPQTQLIQNGSSFAVTNSDDTNFYVGNAGSYAQSGNANTISYSWSAIG